MKSRSLPILLFWPLKRLIKVERYQFNHKITSAIQKSFQQKHQKLAKTCLKKVFSGLSFVMPGIVGDLYIWQTWRICLYSGNLQLNSSTIDDVGSWCLKGWWSRATFLSQRRRYHRNPASGHHPGTVTLIQSVEYLPIPSTYPWEGQVGKKSYANIGKQLANVNDPKG